MDVAVCIRIVDGDTFDTNTGVRIRLARVYAPRIETKEGRRAETILESLILNKGVNYEVVSIDIYGRSVAEVWVDNTNVNDIMRSQGYDKPRRWLDP